MQSLPHGDSWARLPTPLLFSAAFAISAQINQLDAFLCRNC
jgi:hypothetical protein